MATLRPTRPQTLPSLRGGRPADALRPPTRPSAKTGNKARSNTRALAPTRARAKARTLPAVQTRVLPIALTLTLGFVGLTARLFHLQVLRHDHFVTEAIKQREKSIDLPARRGVLLDRDGNLLVQNAPTVDVVIDPNQWFVTTKDGKTPGQRQEITLAKLSALLPEVDVRGKWAERGMKRGRSGRFRTIDVAQQMPVGVGIAIKKAKLLGIGVVPSVHRVAIDGKLASHIIGFTGKNGDGLDGLEHGLDEPLTGADGKLFAEFDHSGRTIPGTVVKETPAQHGADIVLTLDSSLQHTAQTALQKMIDRTHADAATAVVLDPKSGDILALANYPTYDVNQRSKAPVNFRTNRAVSSPYEPGSTLKTITIAGAIEDHKISAESGFFCSGAKKIGKKTIHCHDGEVHHGETTRDVLCKSCNIATADIAFLLGKDRLYHYMTEFGFGAKTGSGLPGEGRGLLAVPSRWSDIQTANISFGQGISVTALQLASAYGALANDGVLVRPRIVLGTRGQDDETIAAKPDNGRRVVSSETARTVRDMLHSVMEEGTGKPARLDGYSGGGKTGTAQVAEHGHYGGKYVASFIGMAPAAKPRFVVLVAITNPKTEHYGGKTAGPVFKEIMEAALIGRRISRDMAPRPKKSDHVAAKD